jgi:hypothetical protein
MQFFVILKFTMDNQPFNFANLIAICQMTLNYMAIDLRHEIEKCIRRVTHPFGTERREFVFSRIRNKESKAKHRCYLYTPDEEILLLAAAMKRAKGKTIYRISMNGREMSEKSPYFVGRLADLGCRGNFIGVIKAAGSEQCDFIKVILGGDGGFVSALPPPDKPGFHFPAGLDEPMSEDVVIMRCGFVLKSHENDGIPATAVVRFQDSVALEFTRKGKNEFSIHASAPLNEFQAFCLAIGIIHGAW